MPKKKATKAKNYANNEFGCCNCSPRNRKTRPYGAKRGRFWCSVCDAAFVSGVDKKTARQEGKKEIVLQEKLNHEPTATNTLGKTD